MRMAQGTTGVFLLDYTKDYEHIDFTLSLAAEARERWSFRGRTRRERSRSRSPERFDEGEECEMGKARKSALWRQRYRERSPLRPTWDPIVDELAERLGDARVGLRKDGDVQGLLEGLGGLLTGSNALEERKGESEARKS